MKIEHLPYKEIKEPLFRKLFEINPDFKPKFVLVLINETKEEVLRIFSGNLTHKHQVDESKETLIGAGIYNKKTGAKFDSESCFKERDPINPEDGGYGYDRPSSENAPSEVQELIAINNLLEGTILTDEEIREINANWILLEIEAAIQAWLSPN